MASTIKLQVRRDLAATWTSLNPTMLIGEIGFETDTRKLKIGTSTIAWNDLGYVVASAAAHTHTKAEITDFGTYAATSHTHAKADITDFGTYAAVSHTHGVADITNLASTAASITAPWTFTTPAFTLSALGSVSGPTSLNLANACFFSATITGATTLSVSGSLTGTSAKNLGIVLTNAGTNITWPASFKWPAGEAPTLTAAGTDIVTFVTVDNGTTWLNIGQVLDVK